MGSIVKINFVQGNKYTENFLPIKIKTLLQEYNYFSAIQAEEVPWAFRTGSAKDKGKR